MKKHVEIIAGLIVLIMIVGIPIVSVMAERSGVMIKDDGVINVVLRQFERGGFPKEIHVKQGETVKLRLTSEDVTHGFTIGDLGIDAGAIHAGKYVTIEFVPEELGKFSYVCTIVCSPLHSKIRGYLIVE
jgi:cytochrome c oxidase subunit II